MDTTRASLLVRIKDRGDTAAWTAFDEIYRPMLQRFALSRGLSESDADDIVQQCMAAISEHIGSFEYDPAKGRFKSWLRTMINNRIRNLLRDRKDRPAESGQFRNLSDDSDTPEQEFDKLWMQEHLWHCVKQIRHEVEETTFLAFQRYVIDQWPVEKVAAEFSLTTKNVYTIKWRLTEKVAAKMKELLDGVQ